MLCRPRRSPRFPPLAALIVLLLGCLLPVSPAGAAGDFSHVRLPLTCPLQTGCAISSLAAGPDGAVWFAEYWTNRIGRITPGGAVTLFPLAVNGSGIITEGPTSLVLGADGVFWYLKDVTNMVGRITPDGRVTEFKLHEELGSPTGGTLGSDGAFWITGGGNARIGRITPAGEQTVYRPEGRVGWPTAAPDGTLWFAQYIAGQPGRIGRISMDGTFSTLPSPAFISAGRLKVGPDGAIWFFKTLAGAAPTVGRVTMDGRSRELLLPPEHTQPTDLAFGPGGDSWITFGQEFSLGRLRQSGELTMFPLPSALGFQPQPREIIAGPDGALWFTIRGSTAIGRVSADGLFESFSILPEKRPAMHVAPGPDGRLWYFDAELGLMWRVGANGQVVDQLPWQPNGTPAGTIGGSAGGTDGGGGQRCVWLTRDALGNPVIVELCLAAAGLTAPALAAAAPPTIREIPLPAGSQAGGIAQGPDGALWVALAGVNQIARVVEGGALQTYDLPQPDSRPHGIAAGPDGALWFTQERGDRIGRIAPDGRISEFPLPAGSGPREIVAGQDGALWFVAPGTNAIGRISAAGRLSTFPIPTPDSRPAALMVGPDGALWFTMQRTGAVGRINLLGEISVYPVVPGGQGLSNLASGPDGGLWLAAPATGEVLRLTPPERIEHLLVARVEGGGTISAAGLACDDGCAAFYDRGATVALSATPGVGQTFAGWSGACSGTGPCTVTLSGDRAVMATFTEFGPPPPPPPTRFTVSLPLLVR